MAKEDDFSMFDDPSFSDFTEEDWEKWRENTKDLGESSASICVGCLNQTEDGSCELYEASEQRTNILAKKCDNQIK